MSYVWHEVQRDCASVRLTREKVEENIDILETSEEVKKKNTTWKRIDDPYKPARFGAWQVGHGALDEEDYSADVNPRPRTHGGPEHTTSRKIGEFLGVVMI